MSYSCVVTPISYSGEDISRLSHLVILDLMQDRQTTDAATETEGSHTKCVSLTIDKLKNASGYICKV